MDASVTSGPRTWRRLTADGRFNGAVLWRELYERVAGQDGRAEPPGRREAREVVSVGKLTRLKSESESTNQTQSGALGGRGGGGGQPSWV